jgi:hypothetical protein
MRAVNGLRAKIASGETAFEYMAHGLGCKNAASLDPMGPMGLMGLMRAKQHQVRLRARANPKADLHLAEKAVTVLCANFYQLGQVDFSNSGQCRVD